MSMGGDFNFSIKPEELGEKGSSIMKICTEMRDSLENIEESLNGLSSWQSVNKVKYEEKIRRALPSMHELVNVIESYGKVAHQTAARIISTEDYISGQIDA